MPPIHISVPGGQQAVYDDAQLRDLWQRGLLTVAALYWIDGMPEWRPLAEYFQNTMGYAPPPMPMPMAVPVQVPARVAAPVVVSPIPRYSFVKDPGGLTRWLKALLWMQLLVIIVSIISDFSQLDLAQGATISKEAAAANDFRQCLVGIAKVFLVITTATLFLTWIYRANQNANGFGPKGMEFTPGWSIGCYFVPFLNLVRPFQAMREIWQVSENPQKWRLVAVPSLLNWWWALWLLSNIGAQIAFRLSLDVHDPSSLATATMVSIVVGFVEIPRNLVAIALVSQVYQMQKALTES